MLGLCCFCLHFSEFGYVTKFLEKVWDTEKYLNLLFSLHSKKSRLLCSEKHKFRNFSMSQTFSMFLQNIAKFRKIKAKATKFQHFLTVIFFDYLLVRTLKLWTRMMWLCHFTCLIFKNLTVFPDMDCTAKHGDVAYCLKSLDKQNFVMWHYSEKFHASWRNV